MILRLGITKLKCNTLLLRMDDKGFKGTPGAGASDCVNASPGKLPAQVAPLMPPPGMDPTHHYYTQHAAEFFHSTVGVDMAPIRQQFIAQLPPGAHILDAGCGSGRRAPAPSRATWWPSNDKTKPATTSTCCGC